MPPLLWEQNVIGSHLRPVVSLAVVVLVVARSTYSRTRTKLEEDGECCWIPQQIPKCSCTCTGRNRRSMWTTTTTAIFPRSRMIFLLPLLFSSSSSSSCSFLPTVQSYMMVLAPPIRRTRSSSLSIHSSRSSRRSEEEGTTTSLLGHLQFGGWVVWTQDIATLFKDQPPHSMGLRRGYHRPLVVQSSPKHNRTDASLAINTVTHSQRRTFLRKERFQRRGEWVSITETQATVVLLLILLYRLWRSSHHPNQQHLLGEC